MSMAKILLIDDDEDFAELNAASLIREGFEAVTARDGLEGIALAKAWKPDMVVVDLLMPRMHGFDVCQLLRQERADLRILVLSGKTHAIDRRAVERLGADRFLAKPCTPRDVVSAVRELLGLPEP